jgi:hypothetical protein
MVAGENRDFFCVCECAGNGVVQAGGLVSNTVKDFSERARARTQATAPPSPDLTDLTRPHRPCQSFADAASAQCSAAAESAADLLAHALTSLRAGVSAWLEERWQYLQEQWKVLLLVACLLTAAGLSGVQVRDTCRRRTRAVSVADDLFRRLKSDRLLVATLVPPTPL